MKPDRSRPVRFIFSLLFSSLVSQWVIQSHISTKPPTNGSILHATHKSDRTFAIEISPSRVWAHPYRRSTKADSMPQHRYSVNFRLSHHQLANGTLALRMCAHINGVTRPISTGIHLQPSQWDHRTQRILMPQDPEIAKSLNLSLDTLRMKCESIFLEHRATDHQLHPAQWAVKMTGGHHRGSFLEFMAGCIEKEAQLLATATIIQHRTTHKKLQRFSPSMRFSDIDVPLVRDFDRWLHDQQLHLNTVHKHHRFFRKYINVALHQELVRVNPYKIWKPNRQPATKQALDIAEVQQLKTLLATGTLIPIEEQVLRGFLACIYNGGIRFSDAQQLTRQHYQNDAIHYIPQKLKRFNKVVRVPVSDEGKKYLALHLERIIPLPSNQVSNRILKRLAVRAEIKKELHFHMSRHTFGTLALQLGMDPEVVKQTMGITKWEVLMDYIHITSDRQATQMQRMNQL